MSSSSIGDGGLGDYYPQQNHLAQNSITAFLAKLWALVNDPSCDDLIAWDPSGGSFHVYDQSRFSREILPRYFKHNNFASFIRQLNMYGFRKMSTIEHGSLKSEGDDIEFAHPSFIRGQDTLLELIKRRAPDNQQKMIVQTNITTTTTPKHDSTSSSLSSPPPTSSSALVSTNYLDTKSTRPVELSHVLDDVRNLQTKQTSLSDKLFHMQDENQALWREIGSLRQKHSKQQQIVSKLMEFLLHFLTNSSQTHRTLVEQQPTNQSQHQQQQTQHHTNNNEQQLSTNSLKRKPAALTLSEEPKKRTTTQQQQLFSQSINIGRQQGIIINELTDNDSGGWLHTTNTSPLVDLVPSPPPSIQHIDDNYQQLQHQQNNYEWTDKFPNSLHLPQQTKTIGETNSYLPPDFFLRADNNNNNNNGTNTNIGQIDEANLTGINTSTTKILPMMKEEQIDFPNSFNQQSSNHIKPSSTLNSSIYLDHDQHDKLIQSTNPSETVPFSLDDITVDVDHIQSSLDNIRDLMFDNLPDGTTIEDLFCDDHALLAPLLQSNTDQTTNILTDNIPEIKLNNHFIYPNSNEITNSSSHISIDNKILPPQCKQIILHKSEIPLNLHNNSQILTHSIPDVNNQLLEQLLNETAKVEEQRNTINQLEREKMNLEGKIHRLEQQTYQRK